MKGVATHGRTGSEAQPRYHRLWLLISSVLLGAFLWTMHVRSWVRRTVLSYWAPPVQEQTASEFVALLFPRISKRPFPYMMAVEEFERTLSTLKESGYQTVSLAQVKEFHKSGRGLPRRALMVALDRDSPQSVELADSVLWRLRMRGVIFLRKEKMRTTSELRHALTSHAQGQLLRSEVWDMGWSAMEEPPKPIRDPALQAVLDFDGAREWTRDRRKYPSRFVLDKTGYNDDSRQPHFLRIMQIRPERSVDENLRIIHSVWPRREEFSDDFRGGRLKLEWLPRWGIISPAHDRLALLPTPRQNSAAVALSGTERWRDMLLEFELKRFQRSFWVYARARDEESFIRFGVSDGFWRVEQKAGAARPINTLGSLPLQSGAAPHRARLLLKGDWAIVHIGGRMQFGRALPLHSALRRGPVQLTVYDDQPRRAMALLSYFKAAPLPPLWIAPAPEAGTQFLDRLRERAMYALALSPQWLRVHPNGVQLSDQNHELLRSLAGFYRCRFIPMAEFSPGSASSAASARQAAEELAQAAETLGTAGLNLRLRAGPGDPLIMQALLERLKQRLRASGRSLHITLERGARPDASWAKQVDGMLRITEESPAGLELLELPELAPNQPL